mgnify:CR=1 FL=1
MEELTDFERDLEELDYEDLDPKIERIKAVATLAIVAIVNILNVYGFAVDADIWINLVGSVLSAVSIVYAWWKNQNVTESAVTAQGVLDALKSAKHAKAE